MGRPASLQRLPGTGRRAAACGVEQFSWPHGKLRRVVSLFLRHVRSLSYAPYFISRSCSSHVRKWSSASSNHSRFDQRRYSPWHALLSIPVPYVGFAHRLLLWPHCRYLDQIGAANRRQVLLSSLKFERLTSDAIISLGLILKACLRSTCFPAF